MNQLALHLLPSENQTQSISDTGIQNNTSPLAVHNQPPNWDQNIWVAEIPESKEISGIPNIFQNVIDSSIYKIFCQIFTEEIIEHTSLHNNQYGSVRPAICPCDSEKAKHVSRQTTRNN